MSIFTRMATAVHSVISVEGGRPVVIVLGDADWREFVAGHDRIPDPIKIPCTGFHMRFFMATGVTPMSQPQPRTDVNSYLLSNAPSEPIRVTPI